MEEWTKQNSMLEELCVVKFTLINCSGMNYLGFGDNFGVKLWLKNFVQNPEKRITELSSCASVIVNF